MLILTQLEADSSYVWLILPAQILLGLGPGSTFMPAMSLATYGVEPRDAGIASTMINTSQQIGGAIGTALLNTIAAGAATTYVSANVAGAPSPDLVRIEGQVHGYTSAIWSATVIVASVVAFLLINAGKQDGQTSAEVEDESARALVH